MKVYSVKIDTKHYQSAKLKDEKLSQSLQMQFNCQPVIENWITPTLTIIDSTKQRGNFIHFSDGTFVMDDEAYYYLSFALDNDGEVLPVHLEGEKSKYYLYNITTCLDCLNHSKSLNNTALETKPQNWGTHLVTKEDIYIQNYHFNKKCLSDAKFMKIPEQLSKRFFVKQDIVFDERGDYLYPGKGIIPKFMRGSEEVNFAKEDLKSEIRTIIETHDLKGLQFDEVWSSR